MKYCPACGKSIPDDFAFCPRCGSSLTAEELSCVPQPEKKEDRSRIRLEELDERFEVVPATRAPGRVRPVGKDYYPAWKDREPSAPPPAEARYRDLDKDKGNGKGRIGWWLLGFLLPVAGLAVYLISREELPDRARSAGNGAFSFLVVLALTAAVSAFLVMNGTLVIV